MMVMVMVVIFANRNCSLGAERLSILKYPVSLFMSCREKES